MVTLVLLALMMAAALGVMLSVVSIRRQVREVEAAGKQAEFESLEHQTLEPRHPDLWDHGPECGVCRYLRAKRVCTPHHGEHNWVEVRLDGARLFEQCRWCGERS